MDDWVREAEQDFEIACDLRDRAADENKAYMKRMADYRMRMAEAGALIAIARELKDIRLGGEMDRHFHHFPLPSGGIVNLNEIATAVWLDCEKALEVTWAGVPRGLDDASHFHGEDAMRIAQMLGVSIGDM